MNHVNAETRLRVYPIDEKRDYIVFSEKVSYNILREKHINLWIWEGK